MSANDEFAARLARIEYRERTGQKAEFAPLLEHPDEAASKKRRGVFTFPRVMLLLAILAFFGGAYTSELLGLMPETIQQASADYLGVAAPAPANNAAALPIAEVARPETPPLKDPELQRLLIGK